MMAPIRFESFVDPLRHLLIGEEALTNVMRPQQLRAQASGYPIEDEQSAALEALMATGSPIDLPTAGRDWAQAELMAIVADYFAMLDDEHAGRPYSKTEHRNALRTTVNRSPGSIERKHQNISAVLQELGLPWINGYKPLGNFQDALAQAVEARLPDTIARLDAGLLAPVAPPMNVATIFVSPPQPARPTAASSAARLSGKFDPAARDAANRALGRAGEDYVLQVERQRLTELGYAELAKKVNWVAEQIGDGLGYDIISFSDDGSPIFIEVKTTKGPITTPFFISENERRVAADRGGTYRIYRLFGFGGTPGRSNEDGPPQRAARWSARSSMRLTTGSRPLMPTKTSR